MDQRMDDQLKELVKDTILDADPPPDDIDDCVRLVTEAHILSPRKIKTFGIEFRQVCKEVLTERDAENAKLLRPPLSAISPSTLTNSVPGTIQDDGKLLVASESSRRNPRTMVHLYRSSTRDFHFATAKLAEAESSYITEKRLKQLGLTCKNRSIQIGWKDGHYANENDDHSANETVFLTVSDEEASRANMNVDILFGRLHKEDVELQLQAVRAATSPPQQLSGPAIFLRPDIAQQMASFVKAESTSQSEMGGQQSAPGKPSGEPILSRAMNDQISSSKANAVYPRIEVPKEQETLSTMSSDLPPGQSSTMHIPPTDSGYGTSLPSGSKYSDPQNQKDTWNQPSADTAETVQTDYSDIQIPRPRFNRYSSELVSCLLEDLKETLQIENILGLVESLPVLFKAFALRLAQSQDATSQRQREVVYFVHRYRKAISKMIEKRCDRESASENSSDTRKIIDGIPFIELCETWLLGTEPGSWDEQDTALAGASDEEEEEDDMSVEDLAVYHKLVFSSPAYSWLLDCIRRNATLGLRGAPTVSSLGDQIINPLPTPSRISPNRPIFPLSMQFKVPWNPIEFLRNQGHQASASHIISKIITLTGQAGDAQATTTEQYLHQTWPATGRHFLGAIMTALRAQESPDVFQDVYPDQTQISIDFYDQLLELNVTGSSYSIAEVGEQLGWLMSALQPSNSATSMSVSRPVLREIIEAPVAALETGMVLKRHICTLDCVIEPFQPPDEEQDGQCWHKLFINPVIVADYPILLRASLGPSRGLEAPFEILIALAETPVLTSFGHSTVMKGYSTMLIPVKQICDIIVWHFVFNETNDRLSFLDSRLSDADSIDPIAVDNHETRHIVGWCSKARSITGSSGAKYDIGRSSLRPPKSHHTLKNISLTASRAPVGGALNFEISKKDKTLACGLTKGYSDLILFLREQHIVLYDVATQCAWLVDGESAALHLVRASLEKELEFHGEDSKTFVYRANHLHNASEDLDGPEAAHAVLTDERNYLLKLSLQDATYHEEWSTDPTNTPSSPPKVDGKYNKTYKLFQHRVVEVCTSLEKIIDHMNNRNAEDGINFVLGSPLWNSLRGFDFMDLASTKNSFPVREMPLRHSRIEEGWTTLTRSLGAIVLFGKDFGNLIQPRMPEDKRPCDGCGFGAAIPHSKNYLITRSSLVQSVLKENGDETTDPWQVVDGLYWQTPDVTFQPCCCTTTGHPQREGLKLEDRVQVLYRWKFPSLRNRGRFLKSVEPDGALIFGHFFGRNRHTGQRGDEQVSELLETKSSKRDSRGGTFRSLFSTLASDKDNHTRSKGQTSLTSSPAPARDGATPIGDNGQVRSAAKGKGSLLLAPTLLKTMIDRASKQGTPEALSSDDSPEATGSAKNGRIKNFLNHIRKGNNGRSGRNSE